MHAYIITGGTAKQRIEKIQTLIEGATISPHDCITLVPSPTSIGVDSVRSVTSRLSIHPIASSCHAVTIRDAQTMTPEAQNAFLKTLEEPPADAIIFLETSMPDTLLPTILSRCQTIRIPDKISDRARPCQFDEIEQLLKSSVGQRAKMIDTYTRTREDALSFVDQAIPVLREKLVTRQTHAKLLRSFLTARSQIMGNITPKLALDAVFLL